VSISVTRRLRVGLGCICVIFGLLPAVACASTSAAASTATSAAGAASATKGNAFSELATGGQQTSTASTTPTATTKTTETTASTATSNSNTSGVLLMGLIAAGALIAGISFLILRDARRVAPVPDGQTGAEGRPARDMAAMMRKRRAKAKAARRQRKRTR
jgi:hypothetical protein